jgi:hypothetical protein
LDGHGKRSTGKPGKWGKTSRGEIRYRRIDYKTIVNSTATEIEDVPERSGKTAYWMRVAGITRLIRLRIQLVPEEEK